MSKAYSVAKPFVEKRSSFFNELIFYCLFFMITMYYGIIANLGMFTDRRWAECSNYFFKLTKWSGAKFAIHGQEYIENYDKPVVFVCNHMSTLETVLFTILVTPHVPTYVIKKELLKVPFFGWGLKARRAIAVSRKDPLEDLREVLEEGVKRIEQGQSVVLFPQTTRSSSFTPAKFTSIGVTLAKRAKVPIIPVALKTDFWGEGSWIKDFGHIYPERKVHFTFGEPLPIKGIGRKEHQKSIEFISSHLQKWGVEIHQSEG